MLSVGILPTLAAVSCKSLSYREPLTARDQRRAVLEPRVTLLDGRTTAVETRRAFGPPDYWSEDGALEAYFSEAFAYFGGTPGDQPDSDRRYERWLLLLKFDRDGVLERHRLHRIHKRAITPAVLDRYARNWDVTAPLHAMQPDTRPVVRSDEAQTAGGSGAGRR